ncbi:MAG: hypothetical protein ACLR0U_20170 [Enterocloster clostridioformis]
MPGIITVTEPLFPGKIGPEDRRKAGTAAAVTPGPLRLDWEGGVTGTLAPLF